MTTTTGLLLAVDSDKVTPGVLGFAVVALLGVATWLLIRSMNRQLRKVDFEERDVHEPARDVDAEERDRDAEPDR
ncbi:MAG TPA: hypothetical protein VF314_06545 [Actinomycetes bacterium]